MKNVELSSLNFSAGDVQALKTKENAGLTKEAIKKDVDEAGTTSDIKDVVSLSQTSKGSGVFGDIAPWHVRCIAKQTKNLDGTVTTVYKNGMKETLDLSGKGKLFFPDGPEIEILDVDKEGIPSRLKATYKGKNIPVKYYSDIIGKKEIVLENYNGKGVELVLTDKSSYRNYGLKEDEIKKLPKRAWAEYEYNEFECSQRCEADGKIQLSDIDLLGRQIIDSTLLKDGKVELHDIAFPEENPKAVRNSDGTYTATWVKKKTQWVENPDGSYSEVVKIEPQEVKVTPYITRDKIKELAEREV